MAVTITIPDHLRGLRCERCGSASYPVVQFEFGKSYVDLLCVHCLAQAIEQATGWKVVRMVERWKRISPAFADFGKTMLAADGVRVKPSKHLPKRSKQP